DLRILVGLVLGPHLDGLCLHLAQRRRRIVVIRVAHDDEVARRLVGRLYDRRAELGPSQSQKSDDRKSEDDESRKAPPGLPAHEGPPSLTPSRHIVTPDSTQDPETLLLIAIAAWP